jgi:hypothetical protein
MKTEIEDKITKIIEAPLRSQLPTSDIRIGGWSSTMLGEKVADLEELVLQEKRLAEEKTFANLLGAIQQIPFADVEKDGAVWAGTRVIDVFRSYAQNVFDKTLE